MSLENLVGPSLYGWVKASAAYRFGCAFACKHLNIPDLEPIKETLEPLTTAPQTLIVPKTRQQADCVSLKGAR